MAREIHANTDALNSLEYTKVKIPTQRQDLCDPVTSTESTMMLADVECLKIEMKLIVTA